MADREYIITFEGEEARVQLKPPGYRPEANEATVLLMYGFNPKVEEIVNPGREPGQPTEYHIEAPSAQRAEQIARVMRKK